MELDQRPVFQSEVSDTPLRPVTIIDYGIGNIASIANMLRRVGASYVVATTPDDLENAESLILPGVGAFDHGMTNLAQRGFIEPMTRKVLTDGTPILGLCLGMQLFAGSSEEGTRDGLGWIEGRCVRFVPTESNPIKVPHMGWNRVSIRQDHPLVSALDEEPRFYFVHGYHLVGVPTENEVAMATHAVEFPAIIARDNVMGVQFHPEKSHRFGVSLMRSFAKEVGAVAA